MLLTWQFNGPAGCNDAFNVRWHIEGGHDDQKEIGHQDCPYGPYPPRICNTVISPDTSHVWHYAVQGCQKNFLQPSSCSQWAEITVGGSPSPPGPPAFKIFGPILDKWNSLGGSAGFLGAPQEDEQQAPDNAGYYAHFAGGSIYWTKATNAHVVFGPVRDKWASMRWEQSLLGYPVEDLGKSPDGDGQYCHFQGGSIYWSKETQAHEVHGKVRDKWSSMGWELGVLGYPITDVQVTPDGLGRFVLFRGKVNGAIFYTVPTGAHEVHGYIFDKWASLGSEKSSLGYPTSDEMDDVPGPKGGRVSIFQNGSIHWDPKDPTHPRVVVGLHAPGQTGGDPKPIPKPTQHPTPHK